MHNSREIALLAEYHPKPVSRRRAADLLSFAQVTFCIGNETLQTTRLASLRTLIENIKEAAPHHYPAIVAAIAESTLTLDHDAFSQSLVYSFANCMEWATSTDGTVGQKLFDCIGDMSMCQTATRDVCRLLAVHTHFAEPAHYLKDFRPFLGADYLNGFQNLSRSLDTVTLNMLVCRWWMAQGKTGQARAVVDHTLGKYFSSRKGHEFFSDQHAVARSAILYVMAQSLSSAEAAFDVAEQLDIIPQHAPRGHCQYFAASFLWQLLGTPASSKRHDALKWRLIVPHAHLKGVLHDLRGIPFHNDDFFSPVSLATTLWTIAATFSGDHKGSVHDVYSKLFGQTDMSQVDEVLRTVRIIQPTLWGMWHTQKTTWAHQLEMDDAAQTEPFANEMDELFESTELMQAASCRVANTLLNAIHESPTPEYFQGASLIADRFLSRKYRKRKNHDPADDDIGMLELAEELSGIKGIPDRDILQLIQTKLMRGGPSILILAARCNLVAGNKDRSFTIYATLFDLLQRHPHWVELYASMLISLKLGGLLREFRHCFRHITQSTTWIGESSLGSLDNRCQVTGLCIEAFLEEDPAWVERAARALSVELTSNFARDDAQLDRFYNLHYTTPFRHLVPRALRQLAKVGLDGREGLAKEALIWDIAFAQRSLLDRRRCWLPAIAQKHSPLPGGECSQALGPAARANAYSLESAMGSGSVLTSKNVTLYRTQEEGSRGQESGGATQQQERAVPRRANSVRENSEKPNFADEASVAATLDEDTVLVKMGFTLNGRFAWSAFRAQHSKLELVGSDHGGGIESADKALKSIVEEFDRACEGSLQRNQLMALVSEPFEIVCNSIEAKDPYVYDYYENLLQQTIPLGLSNVAVATAFPFLIDVFGRPAEWEDGTRPVPSLEEWLRRWNLQVRIELNSTTEEFLSRAALIIDIHEIAKLIDQRDVILMLEESLFAIPISFLKVSDGDRERRLFEIARSVRTVLSPAIHESFRHDESRPSTFGADDQVLCISGVPGNSPDEMVATKRLFERHAELATKLIHPLKWRGAWDGPRGTHDVMARGIHDTEQSGARTALLTVLGHGHCDGGVEMRSLNNEAPLEYWQAHCVRRGTQEPPQDNRDTIRSACDLSSVDFLIQVSCSVGRAEQDGHYDVRGFPANLVVAGARSTAAARWPILADEAERFSNHLAMCYLHNRDEAIEAGTSFRQACIRGLAMAQTRDWWRNNCGKSYIPSGDDFVGLHTAAAFELYGFG